MIKMLYDSLHAILIKHRYLHFFLTGVTGVGLNLFVTWAFTKFYFGLEHYFKAYVIGLSLNLFYNFTLHTIVTFRTKSRHFTRLVLFVIYSILLTAVNAAVVKYVTALVGVHYYLLVIATTIFVFSAFTFVVLKFLIFREQDSGEKIPA